MSATAEFDFILESEALDCEGLRVFAVEGREAISELFRFDIDFVALQGGERDIAPGMPLSLWFTRRGERLRVIHGVVASVRHKLEQKGGQWRYRVRLVPRASRLRGVATQSIFLNLSVPEIIQQKLDAVGLGAHVSLVLLDSYPKLDFVVQYAETDFALLSRRAEQVGVSYFFVCDAEADRITFVDRNTGFPALRDVEPLSASHLDNDVERLTSLEFEDVGVPGLYAVQDYNYRRPHVSVFGDARIENGAGGIIEYGGNLKTAEEAAALASVRAQEITCRRRVYRAESTVMALTSGHRVTLAEVGSHGARELLLTAVMHRATLPLGSGGVAAPPSYSNDFEAVGTDVEFRPERVTPKPVMPGLVTGVVQMGPDGQAGGPAILDADGRYTVQFHFETDLSDGRVKSSHPVRMAQPFGGTGHGMHFPLRPGTEVVLAFTNGDPDRPILLGAVPNAHTLSPVTGRDSKRNRLVTKTGVAFEIGEKE